MYISTKILKIHFFRHWNVIYNIFYCSNLHQYIYFIEYIYVTLLLYCLIFYYNILLLNCHDFFSIFSATQKINQCNCFNTTLGIKILFTMFCCYQKDCTSREWTILYGNRERGKLWPAIWENVRIKSRINIICSSSDRTELRLNTNGHRKTDFSF